MRKHLLFVLIGVLFITSNTYSFSIEKGTPKKNPKKVSKKTILSNNFSPPTPNITGFSNYCPLTQQLIAQNVSISHSAGDTAGLPSATIQISSGYVSSQDVLSLASAIPGVSSSWSSATGTLTLSCSGGGGCLIPYATLEAALEAVQFYSSSPTPSGTKTFTVTLGLPGLNYNSTTGHHYEWVDGEVSWTQANTGANGMDYYGLQGYITTVTSSTENSHVLGVAQGNSWLGITDTQTEGTFRYVTGPEAGTTITYDNWAAGEPNNADGKEHYVQLLDGIGGGKNGRWNDSRVDGPPKGFEEYKIAGFVVEYGGMPGDPTFSDNTSLNMNAAPAAPVVTTPVNYCQFATASALTATALANHTLRWYTVATGGSPLAGAPTPSTATVGTTAYYVSQVSNTAGCVN